jgi:hypothetical protein
MSLNLIRLATGRLLNAGPETCTRIEVEVVSAVKKAEWPRARRLLHLRLEMRHAPSAEERATIMRILGLIDEVERRGIEHCEGLTLRARERTSLSCRPGPSRT